MSDKSTLNRRRFLQYTGLATGAAATLGIGSLAASEPAQAADHAHNATQPMTHAEAANTPLHRGRMFFTNNTEFATLTEAAERIFPKDDSGPGARELGVPWFIDNQLAGAWGYNAREYTAGPYYEGAATQGSQTSFLRRDVFKQGLRVLNQTAQERFQKDFARLDGPQMDAILSDCEKGKIAMNGFTSAYFFSVLREGVLAGVYADPMYNGNHNMDGWRMKQYPGAQMAYTYLMTETEFQVIEPISLSSMQ